MTGLGDLYHILTSGNNDGISLPQQRQHSRTEQIQEVEVWCLREAALRTRAISLPIGKRTSRVILTQERSPAHTEENDSKALVWSQYLLRNAEREPAG
jgi:hypothetical protein